MRKAEGHEGAEHGVFQRYISEPSFLKIAGVYTFVGHKKIQSCETAGVFSSEMPQQKTQHPALIWQGKTFTVGLQQSIILVIEYSSKQKRYTACFFIHYTF